VRLPDDALKCVVFLGDGAVTDEPEGFEAGATGFFVADMTEQGAAVTYLVTAKHCVTERLSDPFHIRFNGRLSETRPRKRERSFTQLIENPEWHFHKEPDVDLAIMEFDVPAEADVLRFPIRGVLAPPRLSVGDIGPGDITYTVGLFKYLTGESRNIPVVHSGHIAAFPEDERIRVKDWDRSNVSGAYKQIEAYVVQCSAMPGASGSPVFVRKPVTSAPFEHVHDRRSGQVRVLRPMQPPMSYGALFLLGVWQGAWEIGLPTMIGRTSVRDPAGYGVVVPAAKILEILDSLKRKEEAAD
jgi:hypothetical protein